MNELNRSNENKLYTNSQNIEKTSLDILESDNKEVKIMNDNEKIIFTNNFDYFLKKHNINKILIYIIIIIALLLLFYLFKKDKEDAILPEKTDIEHQENEDIQSPDKDDIGLLDNPKPTYSKKLYIKNYLILQKSFQPFMNELPKYGHTHIYSNKIFALWLQGEENIPKLTRVCLISVKFHCKNHEMIIITEKNLDKYIHIPNYILEKYKKGIITKPHFSDIIRIELLIKYGGTWVDASILMTDYEEKYFFKDLFFFSVLTDNYTAGSSWFLTSEKGSPILRGTRDMMYEYWRYSNSLKEYLLVYIFFKFGCDLYSGDCDKVEVYPIEIHKLFQPLLAEPYENKLFKKITSLTSIHKLDTNMMIPSEKELFYQHFIKLYSNI